MHPVHYTAHDYMYTELVIFHCRVTFSLNWRDNCLWDSNSSFSIAISLLLEEVNSSNRLRRSLLWFSRTCLNSKKYYILYTCTYTCIQMAIKDLPSFTRFNCLVSESTFSSAVSRSCSIKVLDNNYNTSQMYVYTCLYIYVYMFTYFSSDIVW